MSLAGINGYIMVDAGMKNDDLDVKIGFIIKNMGQTQYYIAIRVSYRSKMNIYFQFNQMKL